MEKVYYTKGRKSNMSFWVPIIIVLICRVLIGICAIKIHNTGWDDSNLMRDAHGIELFVIYILIIKFLNIHLVNLIVFWFMVVCGAWGIIQLIGFPALFKTARPVALYWTLARAFGVIAMSFSVYWTYLYIWG